MQSLVIDPINPEADHCAKEKREECDNRDQQYIHNVDGGTIAVGKGFGSRGERGGREFRLRDRINIVHVYKMTGPKRNLHYREVSWRKTKGVAKKHWKPKSLPLNCAQV